MKKYLTVLRGSQAVQIRPITKRLILSFSANSSPSFTAALKTRRRGIIHYFSGSGWKAGMRSASCSYAAPAVSSSKGGFREGRQVLLFLVKRQNFYSPVSFKRIVEEIMCMAILKFIRHCESHL